MHQCHQVNVIYYANKVNQMFEKYISAHKSELNSFYKVIFHNWIPQE